MPECTAIGRGGGTGQPLPRQAAFGYPMVVRRAFELQSSLAPARTVNHGRLERCTGRIGGAIINAMVSNPVRRAARDDRGDSRRLRPAQRERPCPSHLRPERSAGPATAGPTSRHAARPRRTRARPVRAAARGGERRPVGRRPPRARLVARPRPAHSARRRHRHGVQGVAAPRRDLRARHPHPQGPSRTDHHAPRGWQPPALHLPAGWPRSRRRPLLQAAARTAPNADYES